MSTSTPTHPTARRPRSLTDGLGLPELADVRAPGFIARRPRWLVAGVVLAVLLAVSATIRTVEIGGTLWWAEADAIGTASQPVGGVLHATFVGGGAPLYYLLLHFWIDAIGNTPGAARDLSLVFALACVPLGGWAGWSLAGERGALYGAILFAFSSFLTAYGQQAQPYALLVLFGLLASTAFVHGFVHRRRRHLWLFVGAVVAALYTQGSTGIYLFGAVAALGVVVGCAPPAERRAILRDALLCAIAIIVLFIPWIPATIHQIAHATYPWHYAPVIQSYVPSDLVGGDRVDADLLVILVMGIGPFLLARGRRREPEAVALYALLTMTVAALLFGLVANLAAPVLLYRYFAMTTAAILLLATLCAARTKIVGLVAVALVIVFCADPAAFASSHPSNMNEVAGQLGGRLHPGDVVAVAQPEASPLAWYYLDRGLRWESTLGPVRDPRYMNWDDALARLRHAAPGAVVGRLVASLRPGQQLLFIRPLTEGAKNWEAPWSSLVQLRAAQWGQLLTADVARGMLTEVGSAPENYPGDCCVAASAVLYRRS
ncbi:MAG TPA: glycosyltransferase family 39 protein [Solirubrobacteraceae bacterium]|nr:glycosyltransferase family 39 protein [Solirubrobacteraceae bacterium]